MIRNGNQWFPFKAVYHLGIRALCTVTSLAAGFFGFLWAIQKDLSGAEIFVQAGMLSFLGQSFLISIASVRKDRFVQSSDRNLTHLRSSIAASLALMLMMLLFALTGVWLICFGTVNPLLLFVSLFMISNSFQVMSYARSSSQQIRDLNRFWKIQLAGALSRLASVLLLVLVLGMGFLGVIVSNVIAAALILHLYKSTHVGVKYFRRNIYMAARYCGSLISLDGMIRSLRLGMEPQMLNASILFLEITLPVSHFNAQVAYASTGFINSLSTGARQIFASAEHECFMSRRMSLRSVGIVVLCISLSLALFSIEQPLIEAVLSISDLGREVVSVSIMSIALYLLVYPFTLGYAFIDYSDSRDLKIFMVGTFLVLLVLLSFLLVGSLTVLAKSEIINKVPLWSILPTVAIMISLRSIFGGADSICVRDYRGHTR